MHGDPLGTWWLGGLHAMIGLWAWALAVLLHALWRTLHRGSPDPPRPAGPLGRAPGEDRPWD